MPSEMRMPKRRPQPYDAYLPEGWLDLSFGAKAKLSDEQRARNEKRLRTLTTVSSGLRDELNGAWADSYSERPFAVLRMLDEHERRLREEPEYQAQVERDLDEDHKRERRAWLLRMDARGVPVKDQIAIADDTLDGRTASMKAVLDFVARPGLMLMLVLAGPCGTGKSTAAGWLVGVWEHGDARFVTATALSRMSTYDAKVMAPIEGCSLLVIDDLGVEFADAKGFAMSTLDALINQRYADQLPTIMTTNLTADGFKARYGERLADRLRETGAFVWCGGASLRGKASE